jgi:hypothetical protein
MVCLRNICINTLQKGAKNDDDNNNNKLIIKNGCSLVPEEHRATEYFYSKMETVCFY